MYSTSINDENGLTPNNDIYAHSPLEAEIEFIPNLSQLEVEAELLSNICTGTPSPPPPPRHPDRHTQSFCLPWCLC